MIRYVNSPLLDKAGVVHAFFERVGGVSKTPYDELNIKSDPAVPDSLEAVMANRARALMHLKLDPERLLYLQCNQGSNRVAMLKEVNGGETILDIDGAVTQQAGFSLGFGVADCVPVLLYDPVTKIAGVAHAGWKGTSKNVTGRVVETMINAGAKPNDIIAAIGPCICAEHYEIKEDVASQFNSDVLVRKNDKIYLDLAKANHNQLEAVGVTQIDTIPICTYEHTDRFYSARKEGKTGRFLAAIGV